MKCPYCAGTDTRVLESREIENATRRRRECYSCKKRFTTYERIEKIDLSVIKKDGRKEQFSREKLERGMLKALEKRPVTVEQVDNAVDAIERNLRRMKKTEVPSIKIGQMVMSSLKKLDKIAYLRFASVYKEFEDIGSFREELDILKGGKNDKKRSNKTHSKA